MKTLRAVALVVAVVLVFDIGVAQFCRANCDFWQNAYPPNNHRVRSEAYHHGLAPNRRITDAWRFTPHSYPTSPPDLQDDNPPVVPPRIQRPRCKNLLDYMRMKLRIHIVNIGFNSHYFVSTQ